MKLVQVNYFLLAGTILFMPHALHADSLGRLFTTDQERKRLDYIRSQKTEVAKKAVNIEEVDDLLDAEVDEVVIKDKINVKGIVKRGDGKNSAWINDSNTYEGNLDTLYMKVQPEGISDDKVVIKMPDNETEIEVKVGESYDPNEE